jgi:hypothetical protein
MDEMFPLQLGASGWGGNSVSGHSDRNLNSRTEIVERGARLSVVRISTKKIRGLWHTTRGCGEPWFNYAPMHRRTVLGGQPAALDTA